MAMDRSVPRHEQDIVKVATELESQLAVEIWLQPSFDRAAAAFAEPGVGILHIDTHGQVRINNAWADARRPSDV